MNRLLSAIVVDDEPLAREGLRYRLEVDARIQVLAECASADQALLDIERLQPDVVFLDIEMPGMSGLDLAKQLTLHAGHKVKVVFVTAFREFAINAFDFKAFDYLLKPFADERLHQCIENLLEAFSQTETVQQHQKLGLLLNRKTGNSIDGLLQNLEVANQSSLNEPR